MSISDQDSLIVFSSQDEAVKWLLTAFHEQQKEIIRLKEDNAAMRLKMASLESLQEQDVSRICLDIAQDRKRLTKLENPRKPQDTHLLDELYEIMTARGPKQVDFATAARMVKRSKSRMLQLKAEIGQDMRFMLVPSESHSQKVLIRLR